MRRTDKEMTDTREIVGVVAGVKICRLAMAEGERPYVVPLNFGYEYSDDTLTLFFHGARAGRKMDILAKNPRVCFEMDRDLGLIAADTACGHGYAFECVVGEGEVEFIDDWTEKTRALNLIMRHQTGHDIEYAYEQPRLDATAVYRLRAEWFTGKRKAHPGKQECGGK